VLRRKDQKAERSSLRLLIWTAIAGLIFGLIGFGELPEDLLRTARNSLHSHKASGDIVLIKLDDRSLREVGRWPWPRGKHAELIDQLTKAGANRIFVDVLFSGTTDKFNDDALANSIARSKRVVLPVKVRAGPSDGSQLDSYPLPAFAKHAQLASISLRYNYSDAAWRIPYAIDSTAGRLPSFAALLAKRPIEGTGVFIPDYSIALPSIPTLSGGDVIAGRFDAKAVRGKDVVIGATTDAIGDQMFIPGTGRMGAVHVQIVGAETLKAGNPVYLGWFAPLALALLLCAGVTSLRPSLPQSLFLAGVAFALLFLPTIFEARLVFFDITPAVFVLLTVSSVLGWRRYRARGLVNHVSNLPNLNALRGDRDGRRKSLVAARILNYDEIVATLPAEGERQLVEQVVSRLSVGDSNRKVYQGDGGIFAWFEEPRTAFSNHLDALYSLFRNPARVGDLSLDLTVAFGVEVGSGRSLPNRLASALVAADEAAHDGLRWKYHNPESLQDASWKLSMLSQLDEAIDRGEVWVAYQPKLDLAARRIVGAEALARWTHPEKGPIAASEFVAAAEQHGRIGKLTDFVLDKAISSAAAINKRGIEFGIAVNLSARLLGDKGFTLRVSALLARHGLAPHLLTLELTETAELTGSGEGIEMITRLRELGIRISIDDYGTGLSTLDYLKKIPANEIKIDQSFVKGMVDNRSDRVMVQSTISLAHSLARKVVAEGVEDRDTLELLIEMHCDVAQGFAVGRPMSIDSLTKRLSSDRKRSVA
jgi:EAL domain-containing protein (putative c-di-GMP-specific phosphodiesterase class I)/CHASE2 domain-containing sensor protein